MTRTEQRRAVAQQLTQETGHVVRDMGSCYGLEDGAIGYLWTPLYRPADVRRIAQAIARRTPEETAEAKAKVLNIANDDECNKARMAEVRKARKR